MRLPGAHRHPIQTGKLSVIARPAGTCCMSLAKLPVKPAGHRSSVNLPALVIVLGNCRCRSGRGRTVNLSECRPHSLRDCPNSTSPMNRSYRTLPAYGLSFVHHPRCRPAVLFLSIRSIPMQPDSRHESRSVSCLSFPSIRHPFPTVNHGESWGDRRGTVSPTVS